MAQNMIEVLKVLFPKNALINRKSSEHNKIFSKIFEEEPSCRPHDQNFAFLAEILTSDQSVRSMRVTRVAIKVLKDIFEDFAKFWSEEKLLFKNLRKYLVMF